MYKKHFSDKEQISILEANMKTSRRSYLCPLFLIELVVHETSSFLVLPWSQATLRVWKSYAVSYTTSRKSIFNPASWIAFHGNRKHQTHAKWEIKAYWKYCKRGKIKQCYWGILLLIYLKFFFINYYLNNVNKVVH